MAAGTTARWWIAITLTVTQEHKPASLVAIHAKWPRVPLICWWQQHGTG